MGAAGTLFKPSNSVLRSAGWVSAGAAPPAGLILMGGAMETRLLGAPECCSGEEGSELLTWTESS